MKKQVRSAFSFTVVAQLRSPNAEPLTDFDTRLHFFAGSAVVRFEVTLRNPRKADHPGGLWDLGNGGSVYLRDAALTLAFMPASGAGHAPLLPGNRLAVRPMAATV